MRLFFAVFFLFLFTGNAVASRAGEVKEGNALYLDGDYAASIRKYEQALAKDSESDIVNFDIGTAYYKNKDYPKALSSLRKSLLSEDTGLLGKAHYNLGNAYYQSGIVQEENDIDAAIALLKQSLAHFENALKIDDKDTDAGYNHEFVKKELDRLKEEKEQVQEQQGQEAKETQEGREDQESREKQQARENDGGSEAQGKEPQPKDDPPPEEESQGEQEVQSTRQTREGEEKEAGEGQVEQAQVMSEEEARMLLDNYQQNEEPKGLFNFIKRKGKEIPVLKDW